MMYVIGLGLDDEKDITLRGLEAVKKCEKVFMEAYTSLLSFGLSDDGIATLENLYGKPITIADKEMVEEKADEIMSDARASDVAFLVVGDPFGFYEKIEKNRELGLHTLCLLDIRVKEPSWESLSRGKKKYEPPRYMTINTAIEQLLEVVQNHGGSQDLHTMKILIVLGLLGCEARTR